MSSSGPRAATTAEFRRFSQGWNLAQQPYDIPPPPESSTMTAIPPPREVLRFDTRVERRMAAVQVSKRCVDSFAVT